MAIGYFIREGDKTSCSGRVLCASSSMIHHGLLIARVGDAVSCGKENGIFKILSGVDNYTDDGICVAGTLDSISSCPCRAKFYASEFSSTYEKIAPRKPEVVPPAIAFVPEIPTAPVNSEPEQHAQSAKKHKVEEPKREPVDAGFCIVDLPSNVEDFGNYLFYSPVKGARELYNSLNGTGSIKPASIVLLVDPLKQEPHQIDLLKKAKVRIDKALDPLTKEEASFLHRNYEAINLFTSTISLSGEVAAEVAGKYFEEIELLLSKIQNCYKNQYISNGTLISTQFNVERNILFKKLDSILTKFTKQKLGLLDYTDIRNSLGLSSRSITQRWDRSGVSDIEGYAVYIENAAKYVKIMKLAGYIGISLSGVNTLDKIYEACTVGTNCEKVALIEIGSFAGGIYAGTFAAKLVSKGTSTAVCEIVLGLASAEVGGAGMLACGIVFTGAVGYGAGEIGSSVGGSVGEFIYKVFE